MTGGKLIHRIQRSVLQLRLQPIRVFCFHQVSERYDSEVYCKPDWMSLDDFKRKVQSLQHRGYTFISLSEAYRHISDDKLRRKKYAVLTCDDGLKCQAALIPWLESQKIPLTLFVTAKYLDGKSCGDQILRYFGITDKESERKLAQRLYLTVEEFAQMNYPLVEIGMHGFEHIDYQSTDDTLFENHLQLTVKALHGHLKYIPFFAYPYGTHTLRTDMVLRKTKIIPVYIDGQKNINDINCIHREMI